jgi:tagatose 1,6-diphosphate aldolase
VDVQPLPTRAGPYVDGELELHLARLAPADPVKSWVPAYHFDMRVAGERAGHIQLRIGNTHFLDHYAGYIGYTVELAHRGNRFAARATRLLLPFARERGFRTLWITADPRNAASRRSLELTGAILVEIVDLPTDCEMYALGDRQRCRYRIDLLGSRR